MGLDSTATFDSTIIPTIATTPPNLCEEQYFNAVASLRGEIFIFKNEYVWRLNENFRLGNPIRLHGIFTDIPHYVRYIDAAYERKTDGSIILFHGNGHNFY